MEAAQRFIDAKERYQVGSDQWAEATAMSCNLLMQEECAEVAKPEWWSDEELMALSARVVWAAPNATAANDMRARVLCGHSDAWEAGPRTAAELMEAAAHYERAAALCKAPALKANYNTNADWCRNQAAAM